MSSSLCMSWSIFFLCSFSFLILVSSFLCHFFIHFSYSISPSLFPSLSRCPFLIPFSCLLALSLFHHYILSFPHPFVPDSFLCPFLISFVLVSSYCPLSHPYCPLLVPLSFPHPFVLRSSYCHHVLLPLISTQLSIIFSFAPPPPLSNYSSFFFLFSHFYATIRNLSVSLASVPWIHRSSLWFLSISLCSLLTSFSCSLSSLLSLFGGFLCPLSRAGILKNLWGLATE